jgi:hypothetical protein
MIVLLRVEQSSVPVTLLDSTMHTIFGILHANYSDRLNDRVNRTEILQRSTPRPQSRRPNVTARKPGLRPLLQLARPRSIVMSTLPKSRLQELPKQETKNFEEMSKLSALRLSLRDSYVSIPPTLSHSVLTISTESQ